MKSFFSASRLFFRFFLLFSLFLFFFFYKLSYGKLTPLQPSKSFLKLSQISFGKKAKKFRDTNSHYRSALKILNTHLYQRRKAMETSAWKGCQSPLRKCWEKKKFDLLAFYARGWYQSRLKLYEKAIQDFQKLLPYSENFALEPHLYYELARIYVEQGTNTNLAKAKGYIDEAFQLSLTRDLKIHLNELFAQWAVKNKDWKLATQYLLKIRKYSKYKKNRDFIYNMARVLMKQNQTQKACTWVRKLYVNYPRDWQVQSWGENLDSLEIDQKAFQCKLDVKHFQKRLKYLCSLGMRSAAEKELNEMLKNPNLTKMDETDLKIAIWDFYDELEKIKTELLSYYDEKKQNKDYILKLANVYSQLGNYDEAMRLFNIAYDLDPLRKNKKSRWKNKILWKTFGLSFRFRKYDIAEEKLNQIQAKSCEKNHVLWYRGWLHYLSQDFSKAYQAFSSLDFKRKPHCFDLTVFQRAKYWAAISLQKQNKLAPAKYLLKKLSEHRDLTYYSILANIRLKKMELQSQPIYFLSHLVGWKHRSPASFPTEDSWKNHLQSKNTSNSDFEMKQSSAELEKDYFWEQASQLYWMGNRESAQGALVAVRKRSRSSKDWLKLIEAYKKVEDYSSAAYVANVYFQEERKISSMNIKNPFWAEAYPQVYASILKKQAKIYDISPSFLWAIMRSESFYRKKALSSAGAIGLMQMIPLTAMRIAQILNENKDFHPSQFMKPKDSIRYGAYYLHRLKNIFNRNLVLTAASYNAGPHRVKTWLMYFGDLPLDAFVEHIPYLQTRKYVRKVVLNYYIYSLLYGKKKQKEFDMEKVFAFTTPLKVRYVGPYPTKESW